MSLRQSTSDVHVQLTLFRSTTYPVLSWTELFLAQDLLTVVADMTMPRRFSTPAIR